MRSATSISASHIERIMRDLTVSDLRGGYQGTRVVDGVSFVLRPGQKLGVLGRNGVGKTTLLSCIMGLADIQAGTVRFGDHDLTRLPTWRRARSGIGVVPQARDIFGSLTVEENLLSAVRSPADRQRVGQAYELFPRLHERRSNGGTQLSGGEQQMLAVARAMVPGPSVLLMDEPLEGLAPRVRIELLAAISAMVDRSGIGCVLVEQHIDAVLDFADTVLILERGRPVFLGEAGELRSDPAILERTVGLSKHRHQ